MWLPVGFTYSLNIVNKQSKVYSCFLFLVCSVCSRCLSSTTCAAAVRVVRVVQVFAAAALVTLHWQPCTRRQIDCSRCLGCNFGSSVIPPGSYGGFGLKLCYMGHLVAIF